jgi:hypothetical protein
MEWVAGTLHTTSEHGVSSITTADAHTSAASSPCRFAERRILVSARVPSHFKRSLRFGKSTNRFCNVYDTWKCGAFNYAVPMI